MEGTHSKGRSLKKFWLLGKNQRIAAAKATMKKWQRRSLRGLLIILILVAGGLGWFVYKALPIGTGYAAKYICSSVFISQRDPGAVFKDDIQTGG